MRVKDAVGRYGEDVAARYLMDAGLVILERNWRCRAGELDIIATDGPILIFCEVKTRSSLTFGSPAEAITPAKAARIRRVALQWLIANRDGSSFWPELRFDVIGVVRQRNQPPLVEHLAAAF